MFCIMKRHVIAGALLVSAATALGQTQVQRKTLSAANLTTFEVPLKDDYEAQKIMSCGRFLGQMFAGGTFEDDAACH